MAHVCAPATSPLRHRCTRTHTHWPEAPSSSVNLSANATAPPQPPTARSLIHLQVAKRHVEAHGLICNGSLFRDLYDTTATRRWFCEPTAAPKSQSCTHQRRCSWHPALGEASSARLELPNLFSPALLSDSAKTSHRTQSVPLRQLHATAGRHGVPRHRCRGTEEHARPGHRSVPLVLEGV